MRRKIRYHKPALFATRSELLAPAESETRCGTGSRTKRRKRRNTGVPAFGSTVDVLLPSAKLLREIAMEQKADRDRMAEEAVGQRHGSAPPFAATKSDMSQEEAARRFAASSGAEATTPERTAESTGERVGDAYSDPRSVARYSARNVGQQIAPQGGSYEGFSSNRFDQERFLTVVAAFALGYLTAVLLHSRNNSQFGTISGPFQITKPPQGDQHSRGFVAAAVLKTITEHPQGMTTAEITAELGPQGIGPQSIAIALGALVQAEKVSSQREGGKYFPAAAEVPTAPDQPSS
jgi:hypothetical protein